MAAKKNEKAEITLEALIAAAEDVNKALGIDPAIDTEGDKEEIEEALKKEAGQIGFNPKTEKFDKKVLAEDQKNLTEDTWKLLEELGALGHIKEAEEAEKKAADDKAAEKAKADEKKAEAGTGSPVIPKYTKLMAEADAISAGGGTIDEIAVAAGKLSVAKGGKDIAKSALDDLKWLAEFLKLSGPIQITKDGKIIPAH